MDKQVLVLSSNQQLVTISDGRQVVYPARLVELEEQMAQSAQRVQQLWWEMARICDEVSTNNLWREVVDEHGQQVFHHFNQWLADFGARLPHRLARSTLHEYKKLYRILTQVMPFDELCSLAPTLADAKAATRGVKYDRATGQIIDVMPQYDDVLPPGDTPEERVRTALQDRAKLPDMSKDEKRIGISLYYRRLGPRTVLQWRDERGWHVLAESTRDIPEVVFRELERRGWKERM